MLAVLPMALGVPVYLAVTALVVAVLALLVAILTRDRRSYEAGARIDRVTGLAARAAWEAAVNREINRARRYGQPFCVALIDLDRHHGAAGDRDQLNELIRDVAQTWQAALRTTDLLARVGEARFGALLLGCQPAEARIAVDRVRSATPEHLGSAAGVTAWNGSEPLHGLVSRAEQALARAKRAGGATIVVQAGSAGGGSAPSGSTTLSAPRG